MYLYMKLRSVVSLLTQTCPRDLWACWVSGEIPTFPSYPDTPGDPGNQLRKQGKLSMCSEGLRSPILPRNQIRIGPSSLRAGGWRAQAAPSCLHSPTSKETPITIKQDKLLLSSVTATNLGICGATKGRNIYLFSLCVTIKTFMVVQRQPLFQSSESKARGGFQKLTRGPFYFHFQYNTKQVVE